MNTVITAWISTLDACLISTKSDPELFAEIFEFYYANHPKQNVNQPWISKLIFDSTEMFNIFQLMFADKIKIMVE